MKTIRLLILEDDLETLSKLFVKLTGLENKYAENNLRKDFSVVVLSEYTQVEDYINNNPKANFDIILLDRDCKVGGSFHVLDLERFGVDKVISISSIPQYNEEARKKGITKIVHKDFQDLDNFADKVVSFIEHIALET